MLQYRLFSNVIQFTHGKVNVRDQNLGGLQSLCDNKTESKVIFFSVFSFSFAVAYYLVDFGGFFWYH